LVRFNDESCKSALKDVGVTDAQIENGHVIYMAIFYEFFDLFLEDLRLRLPDFTGSISFVFDQNTNALWEHDAHKMFSYFKQIDPRFDTITFGNNKTHLPLQAADMIAYRLHQLQQNRHKAGNQVSLSELDYALWGNYQPHELKQYIQKLQDADRQRALKDDRPQGNSHLMS